MKIKQLLFALLCLSTFAPSRAADLLDADGYPVMYVRGAFNNWRCDDAYCMTRSGSTYSITLDRLDGAFKVSGTEWQCNYGGATDDVVIAGSADIEAVNDGKNLMASALSNVTISFDLVPDSDNKFPKSVNISFVVGKPVVKGLSGTLPVLYINVYKTDESGAPITDAAGNKSFDNEIISPDLAHKNYFAGEYWLDVNDCQWLIDLGAQSVGSEESPLPLEIKARGNYTRIAFAKKPFKLKLGKKQNLLGLTPDKSKHYAILAHADDSYGYLRNFTGFNLGERIGLPWTPSQQPVEVVINGDYRGLYFLTESIRVGDGRVDIKELKDKATDPELISGGYLVELDNYDETNQIQMSEKSCVSGHYLDMLRVTWDTPEEYSDIQQRFVREQFETMNDLVGDCSDRLWQYLDMDDAVRYYLVKEIISDVESFHGSTYLYRDRGEDQKWHFSPLWDCGNAFNGPTNAFFYNADPYGNTWIPSLRANATFNSRLEDTWRWFMSTCYTGLYDDIDAYVSHIADAAKADAKRWRDVQPPMGGVKVVDNSNIADRRNAVVSHLQTKIAWLAKQFGSYGGSYAEPSRDTTPAAPLPDYAKAGVEDVAVDTGSPAEYFDIYGRRVAAPAPGGFYIVRRGSQTTKTIVH